MSFANASNSAVEAHRSDAAGEGATLGFLERENRLNRKFYPNRGERRPT